jgi:UDP-GlcNAc:undecaprenyl-phosphate GlcNAc-1-phosphate transferase
MPNVLAQSAIGLRYFKWDEVLSPYVFVFYVAYLVTFFFTPVMRHIARYYGIIDQPDGLRKIHTQPVAYLGGVAVFLGWLAGLAMSQFVTVHHVDDGMPKNVVIDFSIVVAACMIVLLGLWDDVRRLSPWKKITVQAAAALVMVGFGVGRRSAWIFIEPIITRLANYGLLGQLTAADMATLYMHDVVLGISAVFVVAIVVLCCNATNLMDGLDGLCGGVTAIIAAGFVFLAVNLATSSGGMNINQDVLRVVLGLALLGAVLAFVPFNFNPASIFMGDTGSMLLGFSCATMMILFAAHGHFRWFLAAMVMFALPILDTTLAFVRRWVNGRPVFSADRHHFHHQLVARGFTVKQTVIISYALSLIFCLLGMSIVFMRARYAVGVYLVVFGSIIVAAYKMGMVHERAKKVTRQPLTAGAGGMEAVAATPVESTGVLEVPDEGPQGGLVPAPDAWADKAAPAKAGRPVDLAR